MPWKSWQQASKELKSSRLSLPKMASLRQAHQGLRGLQSQHSLGPHRYLLWKKRRC